jgi:hypothetical protein
MHKEAGFDRANNTQLSGNGSTNRSNISHIAAAVAGATIAGYGVRKKSRAVVALGLAGGARSYVVCNHSSIEPRGCS